MDATQGLAAILRDARKGALLRMTPEVQPPQDDVGDTTSFEPAKDTDVILRSLRSKRLEGWLRVPALPSADRYQTPTRTAGLNLRGSQGGAISFQMSVRPLLMRQAYGRTIALANVRSRDARSLVSHLHFFVLLSSAAEFGKALGAAAGPFAAGPSTSNDTVA